MEEDRKQASKEGRKVEESKQASTQASKELKKEVGKQGKEGKEGWKGGQWLSSKERTMGGKESQRKDVWEEGEGRQAGKEARKGK